MNEVGENEQKVDPQLVLVTEKMNQIEQILNGLSVCDAEQVLDTVKNRVRHSSKVEFILEPLQSAS